MTQKPLLLHPAALAEAEAAIDLGSRRAVLRRFPYYIVFRETSTSVEVIAVAHGRRKPEYWKDRIG